MLDFIRRAGIAAAVAVALVWAPGCAMRRHPPGHHVHDDHCGHYWDGHGWQHAHNHHHGPGCGHRQHGGRWIVIGIR